MFRLLNLLLLICITDGYASTGNHFTCNPADITVDTIQLSGTEYHLISLDGFTLPADGITEAGYPTLPLKSITILIPPGCQINSINIIEETWIPLPGKYFLYPAQTGLLSDTTFTTANPIVYNSSEPYPTQPVEVSRQGSAMGYSVATLSGSPVRYLPADSTVLLLTTLTLDIRTGPSEFEQIIPRRETDWSSNTRNRGILNLVSNQSEISSYPATPLVNFSDRVSPLSITQSPSSAGDGVDMVIITSSEFEENFEEFADYRTQQGIVTTTRTVEWINQYYSGCDTQQRIRNFIRDAHLEWGIQAVILGGDDAVVPIRECNGWNYSPGPFPAYLLPSDDYYSDIDGSWSYDGSNWRTNQTGGYIDLCLGRWPVNNVEEIELFITKIKLYEEPDVFPSDFARKILLIGSNNPAGNGADDMNALLYQLKDSAAYPDHIDPPGTLYFPHSLAGGDLDRQSALSEFDSGYNLIIHADHSEIHKLATAGNGTLGQYMWDSDFATMNNTGKPSILWSLGCETGHFDGAYCFSEAGLLTSSNSGLVAVMANSRGGLHSQKITAYALCDALYNTGWIAEQFQLQSLHWPLSSLGAAYRCSKNMTNLPFLHLNLLGSPLMYVWRDNPERLSISTQTFFLQEGLPGDVTVTVTDGTYPVENAVVCLWKKDELFSLTETDEEGNATFTAVCVADGDSELVLTAVKRRKQKNLYETTTADYIPDRITIDVLPASMPIISLQSFTVDAEGDGTANPGESVNINLTAINTGGETGSAVSVQMTQTSGQEYVDFISNNSSSFGDISPGSSANSIVPISLQLIPDVPGFTTLEFNLSFSYTSSTGTLNWNSPLFLTVFSESYSLTLMNPSADNSSGRTALINLSDLLLVNTGLGEGENLEITLDNLVPPVQYQVNTLSHSSLESNRAENLSGELNLTVLPMSSTSSWVKPGFPGCSFDVTVNSDGGSFTARNIDVEEIVLLQPYGLETPIDLQTYETGEDYLSLVWEHFSTSVDAEGFYVYLDDGIEQNRVFPLPVPAKQITLEGLLPGMSYGIEVTAVDAIGRESAPLELSANTTCPVVEGWPLHLEGSPGAGAVIADIDNDGSDEIIVATAFGVVNIIERNGSCIKLYPPAGFEFDRFLGCAVGDVDGDSNLEIIVSCQRKIEVQNQEQIAILLFNRFSGFWTSSEIASTGVNEEIASPNIAGTPVLFQADNSTSLEIALRTRGSNGGTPHLYVWRLDGLKSSWINYSSEFPVQLQGYFFSSPTAVDFDEDGFEELITTSYGSSGIGTNLLIADFQPAGAVSISEHTLPELDTSGEMARSYGTLAAAEQNGNYYIAGAAKMDDTSSSYKKVWVYRLDSETGIELSLVWQTEWLTGLDSYGNMPGPSLGNVDDDSGLEVIYSLNGGLFNAEGYVIGWDLISGNEDFRSNLIPFNPIVGGGGARVKSQLVTGLTSMPGSDDMTVFCGFSSLCCGFDPHNGTAMIDGFPGGNRESSWPAPALCDLDGNESAEILYIDYSGVATLFNWQQGSYTDDGWHMYQADPHRSGFYNQGQNRASLDILISNNPRTAVAGAGNGNLTVFVDIEIKGVEQIRTASTSLSVDAAEFSSLCEKETVEVSVFLHGRILGTTLISLENGRYTVEIPLRQRFASAAETEFTVTADPFNKHTESDETNNTARVDEVLFPEMETEIIIPTPAESIQLTMNLPSPLPLGLNITVYSIDGRVVLNRETEPLQSGTTNLIFDSETDCRLPSGMYTISIQGSDFDALTRKVIILN